MCLYNRMVKVCDSKELWTSDSSNSQIDTSDLFVGFRYLIYSRLSSIKSFVFSCLIWSYDLLKIFFTFSPHSVFFFLILTPSSCFHWLIVIGNWTCFCSLWIYFLRSRIVLVPLLRSSLVQSSLKHYRCLFLFQIYISYLEEF